MFAFIDKYFDKLLLLAVVTMFVCLDVFLILHTDNKDSVRWTENQISMVVGGLVGLATGVAIGRAQATVGKDGSVSATASPANDVTPDKPTEPPAKPTS